MPLFATPLSNACTFAAFEYAKRCISQDSEEFDYSTRHIIVCGGFAGLADALLMTPVELIKIRLQLQRED